MKYLCTDGSSVRRDKHHLQVNWVVIKANGHNAHQLPYSWLVRVVRVIVIPET